MLSESAYCTFVYGAMSDVMLSATWLYEMNTEKIAQRYYEKLVGEKRHEQKKGRKRSVS